MMGKYAAVFRLTILEGTHHVSVAAADLIEAEVGFTYESPGTFRFEINNEDRAINLFASGKPFRLYREDKYGGPPVTIDLDGRGVEQ